MKVKGNLLFSNRSFADSEKTQPVIINMDAVTYISGCDIVNGKNRGPKTKVVFDSIDSMHLLNNYIVIEENIEAVATELWNNYDRDY